MTHFVKLAKQIIDLERKISDENEKPNFKSDDLRKRQYLSGLSVEDLELILHPKFVLNSCSYRQPHWACIIELYGSFKDVD